MTVEAPFRRNVNLRTATWMPWLTSGGYPGRKGFVGALPKPVAKSATDALDLLLLCEPHLRADRRVDRALLASLAATATATRNIPDLTVLWVTTMMWGAGTTYHRGPWQTARGLADPKLPDSLALSFDQVANGDVTGAYVTAQGIAQSGESFLTKWLWAAALAANTSPAPLILDKRVREGLRAVGRSAGVPLGAPAGASGYLRYLDVLGACAEQLRDEYPGCTPEKLEWLLFERDEGNLTAWLV